MKKTNLFIENMCLKYTGSCPYCEAYYLDDEDMCQICGWPYNHSR